MHADHPEPRDVAVAALVERAVPATRVEAVQAVAVGFSGHRKWLVATDRGRLFVKVWSPQADPAKQLHAVLVHLLLAAHGLDVPAVRFVDAHAAEVDGAGVTILDHLPGTDATEAIGNLDRSETSEFFRSWGALVGRLHAIDVPCFADRLTGPPTATYGSWQTAVAANLERLCALNTEHGTLSGRELDGIVSWAADTAMLVDRHVRPAVVHRDLYLANTLVHERAFGGLIDFDLAKLWDPTYDFVKLHAWVFSAHPDGWPPFREGYLAHGPVLRSFSARLALASVIEGLSGLPLWRQQANTGFDSAYRTMIARALEHRPREHDDELGPSTVLGTVT